MNAMACSSTNTTPANNQQDSGPSAEAGKDATGGGETSTGTDTGPSGDSTTPTDGGGSAECGSKAPSLHPTKDGGGLYCPFAAETDAGDTIYCGAGSDSGAACCVSGEVGDAYPPSVCAAPGSSTCSFTATSGNTQIQCEDPATDCTGGQVCCAYGGKLEQAENETTKVLCSWDKYADWAGTTCATSCAAVDGGGTVLQLCTSDGECTSPKTCVAFTAKGIDLGYCK
jgi:hypothetical protein